MFSCTDVKKLSTIQECHLILAKLMVLESFEDDQSYSLIKLVNTIIIVNNKTLLLNLSYFYFSYLKTVSTF